MHGRKAQTSAVVQFSQHASRDGARFAAMVEKWLAGLGLMACLAVWAGMALGSKRRYRLLAWWRTAPRAWWGRLRGQRRSHQAQQEAASAIERARRRPKVDRDGNVYKPDAFQHRDGRDRLH
jgi:hypothetical protein